VRVGARECGQVPPGDGAVGLRLQPGEDAGVGEALEGVEGSAPAAAEAAGGNYVPLKAPMIGTFYRSSSPETPAFVQVGDLVEKGQVICIIEAMKLFNEIEAEQSGRVVKALVENASPVEYDQPLFLIEPM